MTISLYNFVIMNNQLKRQKQSIVEDIEALSSRQYINRIAKARRGKRRVSAKEAKKILGL